MACRRFSVPYDYLVIATGCKTNTFNTPGVAEREGKEGREEGWGAALPSGARGGPRHPGTGDA